MTGGRLSRHHDDRVDDVEKRFEVVDESHDFELRDAAGFDRIAFAMRALRILRPPKMKVVVYERVRDLHIEKAADLSAGPGRSYAVVGIPPHASREHIAYRLAELAGAEQVPYMVALLTAS